MFDEKQISALGPNYFNIILQDDRDVTIQSKCTGHVWYIRCCEYPNPASCIDVMSRLILKYGPSMLERIEWKEMRDTHCEETDNVL
ncbi:MAG: hypothetical protein HDR22_04180 [Lachnospiraceae bacterium]|nr:hypothetical protein [Lachnospiraceae bacterium]